MKRLKLWSKKKDKELNDALEKQAIQAEKDFLKCIDNLRAQMKEEILSLYEEEKQKEIIDAVDQAIVNH